jgi:hypothetical protein
MTLYSREFDLERAEVDLETGVIRNLAVFTGGEATDGHVLSIDGARPGDSMPMFVQHEADPRTQLGTLLKPRKDGDALVYDGEILIDGQGEQADIRRDLLLKIQRGHVKRLSGRWDADEKDIKRRTDLPKDHPAYVGENAKGAKRYGLYFSRWVPMEGSVVGLGADPQAVMRWSRDEDSPECVRDFWRAQIPEGEIPVEMEFEDDGADTPSGPDPIEEMGARLDEISERLDGLSGAIVTREHLEEIVSRIHGRVELPEPPPAKERVEEPEPQPAAIMRPAEVAELLSGLLAEARERVNSRFLAEIRKARGEIR